MDESTRRALLDLSRSFYEQSAESFDSTRQHPWPGWRRILPRLPRVDSPSGAELLRVLDAGCGNGRFGRFLAASTPRAVDYTGVDSSVGLIEAARRTDDLPGRFVAADLQEWLDASAAGAPSQEAGDRSYDLVVLFGVLHHVPGRTARRRLLNDLASRVSEGGLLVATWWMLHETPRFEKLRVSWGEAPEISAADLDPGDALLTWQGRALRYCHFPDARELEDLEALPGLVLGESFRSDGPGGRDNLYRLFTRPTAAQA
ncbi:MAG: class I SAM-dependent methyltransferase [Acidobacteriota bacterium]